MSTNETLKYSISLLHDKQKELELENRNMAKGKLFIRITKREIEDLKLAKRILKREQKRFK